MFRRSHLKMKKKWFLYPVANIKNRFIFGSYGKDVYIEPGGVINRPRYVHIGDHVRIKRNTNINIHPRDRKSKEGILFIGKNVHITEGVIISAFQRIVIGNDVGIAPYVCILDNSRKPGDISRPLQEQDVETGLVYIGDESWLAYNACILPNVTIGKHCVIGALSVVNSDIPSYSVAVGTPARVVKRFDFNRGEWVRYPGAGEEKWAEE
jgi:acetyltransferase-like isoleucine patch superfamily enzyme